ncbi:MFS transporter [Salinactinospora qingdaonensis]|uniref:MFS transporter n=1 Tax=Salinactinospora qingdaonensis TaxID=702744 RepID=A0ABP7EWC7_9ACTN
MSDSTESTRQSRGSAAPPTASAAHQRGLPSTFVLALGTFAVGTDAFVLAGFLPSMAETLQVPEAAAGQSVTIFAIAYAVLAPVIATLTAQLERRTLLVAALGLLALANVGSALAPNLTMLLVTRVIAAAGAAAYTPNAGAVAAILVRPELRGRALAVVVGGLTIATALGVPLGSLAGQWFGWRTALGLVAALCLLAAGGVFAIMPRLPGNPRVPLRERLSVLGRPAVLAVLPLTALGMGASYTVYAYSVPVMNAVGVPTVSVAAMLFLYGLGAVVGNLLAGVGTDRWGAVRMLTLAYLAMTASLAVLAWISTIGGVPMYVVGVLVLVWGGSSWSQTPPQQHRLIAAAPDNSSLVVSLNSSAIYLGIGLGTGFGGLALNSGPTAAYILGAVIAAGAAIFLGVTSRR